MTHQTNAQRLADEQQKVESRTVTTVKVMVGLLNGIIGAQHQENAQLKSSLSAIEQERDQLRAQLEALKAGQADPVGTVFTMETLGTPGRPFCHVQLSKQLPTGTKLYTATPKPVPMTEWQPIETAPKDGTELIGWRDDCGVILIRWTSCDAFMSEREIESSRMDEETLFQQDWFCADFIAGCRLDGSETPTHWMPLPPPPTNGISEVRG